VQHSSLSLVSVSVPQVVNVPADVHDQILKMASINLCPNVSGQICCTLMMTPPEPGQPSHDLYIQVCVHRDCKPIHKHGPDHAAFCLALFACRSSAAQRNSLPLPCNSHHHNMCYRPGSLRMQQQTHPGATFAPLPPLPMWCYQLLCLARWLFCRSVMQYWTHWLAAPLMKITPCRGCSDRVVLSPSPLPRPLPFPPTPPPPPHTPHSHHQPTHTPWVSCRSVMQCWAHWLVLPLNDKHHAAAAVTA
jgi:hypothetical protein